MNPNLDLIRGLYDAFAAGNVPAVIDAMDPDIEWNEAENFIYADGNPYIGPTEIVDGVFARLAGEWDGWALATEQFLDAGHNVVVLGRYTATYKRTGARLDAQFAHVWWVRGGKVVKFQQYTDTEQVARVAAGR